jgi:hypothetical protein
MTPVSGAFKKTRVFSITNIKIIPLHNSLKKYREYFPSVISVSDRFFYGTGSVQRFLHFGFRPIFI